MRFLSKISIFIFMILSSFNSMAEISSIFNGRHFTIEIESQCDITTENCENVRFHSVSLATGGSLYLQGRAVKLSGDKPVIGYHFNHGEYSYLLSPAITNINYWHLMVLNQNKLVAEDSGIMK
ncbi:hypothetical protein ACP3TC_18570 [Winslowiella sp. 2C04]|uniref:hypothetical protein n=1 Tax=Winslowiella sp. 2C04 TaxID=3416179 RepID=UPI003CFB47AF